MRAIKQVGWCCPCPQRGAHQSPVGGRGYAFSRRRCRSSTPQSLGRALVLHGGGMVLYKAPAGDQALRGPPPPRYCAQARGFVCIRMVCLCMLGGSFFGVVHAVRRPASGGGSLCAFLGRSGWADRFFSCGANIVSHVGVDQHARGENHCARSPFQ